MTDLKRNSKSNSCDVCSFLLKICEKRESAQFPTVSFRRVQSCLFMNGGGKPVISICRSKELSTRIDEDIQIGYPQLPKAGTQANMEIIRQWLHYCQSNHCDSTCKPPPQARSISRVRMPTRVIDVGKTGDRIIRLVETQSSDKGEWVALSHQWGTQGHFRTTPENKQRHLQGLRYDALPATFRDAVTVTRGLGIPYLWIDSLCIVQGPNGDFSSEAKRMEQVYSGAICVLGIGREPGHNAGFLQDRAPRDAVTLQGTGQTGPFYLCETIDNFNLHVERGRLNQRGWVMQEHALARRTVYFTDYQMYFECGDGVRCETMTKMNNEIASFLGDFNFPHVIQSADQGEKILLYQDLYVRYSQLGFSRLADRAVAISGLQERILAKLGVLGGLGILDDSSKADQSGGLLRRSLLWCRADGVTDLESIDFPPDGGFPSVPSWSWMACGGEISYIKPEFGAIDWEEIQSPWSSGTQGSEDSHLDTPVLKAKAYDYDIKLSTNGQHSIVLDSPSASGMLATKCIVLGKPRGRKPVAEKPHYVLIVAETFEKDDYRNKAYKRIGAGFFPGKCLASGGSDVVIW